MSEVWEWRLCTFCRVRWDKAKQKECPKCDLSAFLTMNLCDIGTTALMRQAGLSTDDFEVVEVAQ